MREYHSVYHDDPYDNPPREIGACSVCNEAIYGDEITVIGDDLLCGDDRCLQEYVFEHELDISGYKELDDGYTKADFVRDVYVEELTIGEDCELKNGRVVRLKV